MYTIVLVLHVIVVISLLGVILVQRGRSGGLVESLSGVESIFGTKTSSFLVRVTVVLVVLFFSTSLALAYLSKEKGKSLMETYQEPGAGKDLFSQEAAKPVEKKDEAKSKATIPAKEAAAKKAADEVE